MKKSKSIVLACIVTLGVIAISANADIYTFQPIPDIDLAGLDHHYYYIWEIKDFSLPADEPVIGASLFFDNINDWTVEDGDILYMRLLSKADITEADVTDDVVDLWKPGSDNNIYRGHDGQAVGDDLSDYGILLGTYTDDDPFPNPPEDFTYNFTQSQWESLDDLIRADGRFGIGLEPDCHYWNDGITLTIVTPVPGAVLLGILGLGVAGLKLRKHA